MLAMHNITSTAMLVKYMDRSSSGVRQPGNCPRLSKPAIEIILLTSTKVPDRLPCGHITEATHPVAQCAAHTTRQVLPGALLHTQVFVCPHAEAHGS